MNGLLKKCAFEYIAVEQVAGTSTLTSDFAVDMQGYDGVTFIALTGGATSGTVPLLTVLGVATNAVTGGVAVAGATATYTSLTSTDADNKMLIVEVNRPLTRYLYVTLARATQNVVLNGIIAIKWKGKVSPVTQSASHVIASTFVVGS